MITVRNEFETIPAFETVAAGGSDRQTAAELLEVVDTVCSNSDTLEWWKTLAKMEGDEEHYADEIVDLQMEIAQEIEQEAPLALYCTLQRDDLGAWRVVPDLSLVDDMELERVEELPDDRTEDELLVVSDHGNATLYQWDPNGLQYKEIWGIV